MKRILALLVFVVPLFSFAGSNFDEGIKAYQDSNYRQAIEKFQASLAETPNDVASYYNLGLAYAESKQFGKAIWSFEKVLKLSPADVDAKDRIETCYAALDPTVSWEPRLNRFTSLLYGFSGTTWSILAIVLSVLLSLCVIFFLRAREVSTKRLFLALGFLSLIFMIASVVIAAGATNHAEETRFAVVTKAKIPTFDTPKKRSSVQLKEGDQLELLEDETSTSTFVRVSSRSGDTYLVKATDVDFI